MPSDFCHPTDGAKCDGNRLKSVQGCRLSVVRYFCHLWRLNIELDGTLVQPNGISSRTSSCIRLHGRNGILHGNGVLPWQVDWKWIFNFKVTTILLNSINNNNSSPPHPPICYFCIPYILESLNSFIQPANSMYLYVLHGNCKTLLSKKQSRKIPQT